MTLPRRLLLLLLLVASGVGLAVVGSATGSERGVAAYILDRRGGTEDEPAALGDLRPEPPAREPALVGRARARSSLAGALDAVQRLGQEQDFEALQLLATTAPDARVRIRALRVLASGFGVRARAFLMERARDGTEAVKVRAEAARLVGRTGTGAGAALDALIDARLPIRVREGAVLGLAEVGSTASASRVLDLAMESSHPTRLAARRALGHVSGVDAIRLLLAFLRTEERDARERLSSDARAGLCRSLGRSRRPEAVPELERLLRADPEPEVRAAAAHALGILGRVEAADALARAASDGSTDVRQQAAVARTRLAHSHD